MYAKIFRQIFDSSISEDYLVRLVFQDMLVLADPTGIVDMTAGAISRRTNVPLEVVESALVKLAQPDAQSRNQDREGRRIALLDDHRSWGWQIINFGEYHRLRDESAKRYKQAERAKRYRDKKRHPGSVTMRDASPAVTPVTRDVTPSSRVVTRTPHEDEDANEDANADDVALTRSGGAGGGAPASEGQSSGDQQEISAETECVHAASYFPKENSHEAHTSPASLTGSPVQTSQADPADVQPPSASSGAAGPDYSTAQIGRVLLLRDAHPGPKKNPAPAHQTSPAAHLKSPAAPAPSAEPWDALDFARTRQEPFAGLDPKELRRVVFFHAKVAKPYWLTPRADVTSVERLEQVLDRMAEQTPADFKVPGSATVILPFGAGDPDCPLCGGEGWGAPVPNEGYEGLLAEDFLQATPCSCQRVNQTPWKTWRRHA